MHYEVTKGKSEGERRRKVRQRTVACGVDMVWELRDCNFKASLDSVKHLLIAVRRNESDGETFRTKTTRTAVW